MFGFRPWRVGSLFGFPIEINPTFLLLLALVLVAFGGVTGVFIVLLTFASIVLHELGHAVVARRLGVDVGGIELGFFGGAAKMLGMPRRPNAELAIAAAGPAVSIALAATGFVLGAATHIWLFALVGWINLVIAGFNLIPALPMDGGRILRALLAKRMAYVKATDIAVIVARVAAVAFAVWGLAGGQYQLVLLAPYLWWMGTREKMFARMVVRDAGDGVEVMPRGFGPDVGPQPPPTGAGRRFVMVRRNGQTVIEMVD